MVTSPQRKSNTGLIVSLSVGGGVVVTALLVACGLGAILLIRLMEPYYHGPPIAFSNIVYDTAPESMCEDIDWLAPLPEDESGNQPEFFMGPATVVEEHESDLVEVHVSCGGVDHESGAYLALFENDDVAGVLEFHIRFGDDNTRVSSNLGDYPDDVPDLENWHFSRLTNDPLPYDISRVLEEHGASQELDYTDEGAAAHLEVGFGTAHAEIRIDIKGDTDTYSTEVLSDATIELAGEVYEYISAHSREIGY